MDTEAKKKHLSIDKWVAKYKGKTYIKIKTRELHCDNIKNWVNEYSKYS
jgi:hypothetical protein